MDNPPIRMYLLLMYYCTHIYIYIYIYIYNVLFKGFKATNDEVTCKDLS